MEGLQKHAYEVYAKNLSVTQKFQLIKTLNDDIEREYDDWCTMMNELIEKFNINIRVCNRFDGYFVVDKRCALRYDDFNNVAVFYIIDRKLGITEWGGIRDVRYRIIELKDVDELCNKQYYKSVATIIKAFIKTHPLLK